MSDKTDEILQRLTAVEVKLDTIEKSVSAIEKSVYKNGFNKRVKRVEFAVIAIFFFLLSMFGDKVMAVLKFIK